MAELAIIVPTLGRADRLGPLVANIAATTPPVWSLLFVVDHDDVETHDALDDLEPGLPTFSLECDGTLAVKTNAGVAATDEPWCLLCGDDVRFYVGWWEAAMRVAGEGVGVIGTNDLHNRHVGRGEYATQMLVARWYAPTAVFDAPGEVFCTRYHHDPVDMEICLTAQVRGAYAHAHDSIIEHLHPDHGLREVDATDHKGQLAAKKADLILWKRRRKLIQAIRGCPYCAPDELCPDHRPG